MKTLKGRYHLPARLTENSGWDLKISVDSFKRSPSVP